VVQELNDVLEGDRKVRARNDDLLARRHRCEERLRGWRWWFIWDEETGFALIITCVACAARAAYSFADSLPRRSSSIHDAFEFVLGAFHGGCFVRISSANLVFERFRKLLSFQI
jgi:hypothetical protein